MKKKSSYKVSARELTKRTDALLAQLLKDREHIRFIHRLVSEYITFEENDSKFKAYLKKREEEHEQSNEVRGSSSENKAPKTGKQKPAKTGGNTKVRPKSGGKKERAVLDTKQASK